MIPFRDLCAEWLKDWSGAMDVYMTPSCTSALEAAALILNVKPGDEVIMPSWTHPSTANAFALRGAVPVFVDVDPATLNLNPDLLKAALTSKTRGIVPIHYAGVIADMESIVGFAEWHGLWVMEDAAQALLSSGGGGQLAPACSFGDLAAISFHDTKNVGCGEGGALFVNNSKYRERAAMVVECGTDRRLPGRVGNYRWQTLGGSHIMGEPCAALLWNRLQTAKWSTGRRLEAWHAAKAELESYGFEDEHATEPGNGHIFWVMDELAPGASHFEPLHLSPAGVRYGRVASPMPVTERAGRELRRLPL